MINPFTRITNLEKRVSGLEEKNESLTRLAIALAKAAIIHPSILADQLKDEKALLAYIIKLSEARNGKVKPMAKRSK